MKFKKIIDLCKKSKRFLFFNLPNMQWLTDGHAIYPLEGLPYLDSDYICRMFDINDSQKNKIFFDSKSALPDNLNFNDTDPTESVTDIDDMCIIYGGTTIIPLKTERGLKFIDNRFLMPFADINRNDLYITLRIGTDGTEYFAVKQGLLLQGIVLPYDVVNENFVDKLNELYRLSDMALNNQKSKSIKSDT